MVLEREPGSGSPGGLEHTRLLAAFLETYRLQVRDIAFELLRLRTPRWRFAWMLEPTVYTLERRRNLFRAAFSLAAGNAIGRPQQGLVAGAAGELGWTCALMLDDILDRSGEREGHPAAHVVFGRARTLLAVVATLLVVMWSGARTPRLARRARLRMEWLGLRLLVVCALSAVRPPRRPDWRAYARHARNINNSTHWAVLAPLALGADDRLRGAALQYADAASLNGKLRNDLLDFCGGSSESDTRFKDFEERSISFPVLALLARPLAPSDRAAVTRHFAGAGPSPLTPARMCSLLSRSGALRDYLDAMRTNAEQAFGAAAAAEACGADELASLMRRWSHCVLDVATERAQTIVEPEPAPAALT